MCNDDYTPCTCQRHASEGYEEVYCNSNTTLAAVRSAFRNSNGGEVIKLRLIMSGEGQELPAIPAEVAGGKLLYEIEVICGSSLDRTPVLKVHPAAFKSTRDTVKEFGITGCDLSELDYTFLTGFSFLQSLTFRNCSNMSDLKSLPTSLSSLNKLIVTDSPNLESLQNLPPLERLKSLSIRRCPLFNSLQQLPILPGLRSLDISSCPQFKKWDVFHSQLTGLHEIRLTNNSLDYLEAEAMLKEVLSSPVAETLFTLHLENNEIMRIPEQIHKLPRLTYLNLDHNQIEHLHTVERLHFRAPKVKLLSMRYNEMHTIEPGAIQGIVLLTEQT